VKLDVFRISLNRKTGEQLGKEHIGRTQIDQRLVAEASVALLTGMTLDETCKALTKAFKESCKGGEGGAYLDPGEKCECQERQPSKPTEQNKENKELIACQGN